ncbi:MAG: ATP-binding protein [Elusimicrobia bacterium]|nr:ATP-binding protein [Elusimicrobiota bacterium]
MFENLFYYQSYISFTVAAALMFFVLASVAVWKDKVSVWLLASILLLAAAYIFKFLASVGIMSPEYMSEVFMVFLILSNIAFAKNAQAMIAPKNKIYFEHLNIIIIFTAIVGALVSFRVFSVMSIVLIFGVSSVFHIKTISERYSETNLLKPYRLRAVLTYLSIVVLVTSVYVCILVNNFNIFTKYQSFFDLLLGAAFLFYANTVHKEAQNISLQEQKTEKYLPKYLQNAPMFAITVLVLVSGFVLVEYITRRYTKIDFESRSAVMAHVSNDISDRLRNVQNISLSLSKLSSVSGALEAGTRESVTDYLKYILNQYAKIFDVSIIYLVNARGDVIGASRHGREAGIIGMNVWARDYITAALSEGVGEAFLVGLKTGESGYYVATAVRDSNANLKGFVVVKDNLKSVLETLDGYENIFVIDTLAGRMYLPGGEIVILDDGALGQLGTLGNISGTLSSGEAVFLNDSFFQVITEEIYGTDLKIVYLSSLEEVKFLKFILLLVLMAVLFIIVLFYIMLIQGGKLIALGLQQKAVLDSTKSVAIISIDMDGKILTFNSGAEAIFGYDENEFRSFNLSKLFAISAQDRKKMKNASKVLGREISFVEYIINSNNISKEAHCLNKDAKEIILLMDILGEYSLSGSQVGYIITATDISKRKLFEAELAHTVAFQQTLIDSIPVAVYYKDEKFNFIGFNKKFPEILGVDAQDIMGKNVDVININKSFKKMIFSTDEKVLKTGAPISYEVEISQGAQGASKKVIVYKSTYKKQDGSADGIIGVILDVTLERKMQEERDIMLAGIERQGKFASLGQLVSGIAHELNNPLSVILGYAQVLSRNKKLDAPAGNAVNNILESAQRSRKIVANMLEFSRDGVMKLEVASVTEVLEKTLEIVLRKLKENSVELIKNYNFKGEDYIMGSFVQLQQAFLNIIINAADAMSLHGGALTLEIYKEGKNIKISFKDTGVGIPKENQTKLFEPFFTTKEAGKGTGLGLSIVYSAVRAHGGDILVESALGSGTNFTVIFPLVNPKKLKKGDVLQNETI